MTERGIKYLGVELINWREENELKIVPVPHTRTLIFDYGAVIKLADFQPYTGNNGKPKV